MLNIRYRYVCTGMYVCMCVCMYQWFGSMLLEYVYVLYAIVAMRYVRT